LTFGTILQSATTIVGRVAGLRTSLQSATRSLQTKETELAAAREASQELQTEKARLEAAVQASDNRIIALEQERVSLTEAADALRQEKSALETEKATSFHEKETAQAEAARWMNEAASSASQNVTLVRQTRATLETLQSQQRSMARLQSERVSLLGRLEDSSAFETEVAAMRAARDEAEAARQEAEDRYAQLDADKRVLEAAHKATADGLDLARINSAELESAKSAAEEAKKAAEETLVNAQKEYEADLVTLRDEVDSARAQVPASVSAELARLRSEVESAAASVPSEVEAELTRLRAAVDNLTVDRDQFQASARLADQRRAEVEERLSTADGSGSSVVADALRRQVTTLQTALATSNRARDAALVAQTEAETSNLMQQMAMERLRDEVVTTVGGLTTAFSAAAQSAISGAVDSVRQEATRAGATGGGETEQTGRKRPRSTPASGAGASGGASS